MHFQQGNRSKIQCRQYLKKKNVHHSKYRSDPVNSKTVNSNLRLNSKFLNVLFATLQSFHVYYLLLIRIPLTSKQKLADE